MLLNLLIAIRKINLVQFGFGVSSAERCFGALVADIENI